MADLRALLESLGYRNVRTLLNSGNAVFEGPAAAPGTDAARIGAAIARSLGLQVPVIVKTAKNIAAAKAENKLAAAATDFSRLLAAFTVNPKSLLELAALEDLVRPPERLLVGKRAAYLWCPKGILQSKAGSALLGNYGPIVTTRNWATVLKINDLLAAGSAPRAT